MRIVRIITFLASTCAAVNCAFAQDINLNDVFAEKLAAMKGIPFNPGTRTFFHFSDFRLIPKEVLYNNVRESALPDKVSRKSFLYPNCTDQDFTEKHTESLTYQVTTTVNVKTHITTDHTSISKASISIPASGLKTGFSGSNKDSIHLDLSKSDSETFKSDIKDEFSGDIKRMAKKITVVLFEKRFRTDYLDFDGVVTVDGDVVITMAPLCGPDGRCYPPPPPEKLRDLLSEDLRTIHIKGEIWNVAAEDTKTSYHVFETSDHPEYCPSLDSLVNPSAH